MSEINRCPTCKRKKRKAIKEQIATGKECTVNHQYCYFSDDIKIALEKRNNILIVKKPKKRIVIIKKQIDKLILQIKKH